MKNKENDNLYKQGSITIEASLIMPLILASIILVIYIAFYEHDKCMMIKAGFSSTLRAERGEDEAASYYLSDEAVSEVIGARTTGFIHIDKDIAVTEADIRTELRGSMELSGIIGLIAGGYLECSFTASGSLEDPIDHIRQSRKWGAG